MGNIRKIIDWIDQAGDTLASFNPWASDNLRMREKIEELFPKGRKISELQEALLSFPGVSYAEAENEYLTVSDEYRERLDEEIKDIARWHEKIVVTPSESDDEWIKDWWLPLHGQCTATVRMLCGLAGVQTGAKETDLSPLADYLLPKFKNLIQILEEDLLGVVVVKEKMMVARMLYESLIWDIHKKTRTFAEFARNFSGWMKIKEPKDLSLNKYEPNNRIKNKFAYLSDQTLLKIKLQSVHNPLI